MNTLGLAHVNLRAQRTMLDQLYTFYTAVVGLREGERPPFPRFGYWLYAGGHDVLHLLEASPDEERLVNVVTTIDHVAFRCQGLEAFEEKLQRLGVPYKHTKIPLSSQDQLVLKDPAGNVIELNFPNKNQQA